MTWTDQQASSSEACLTSRGVCRPADTRPRNPQVSYYRARYYDQNAGRFLSEDPSNFFSGSINFYEYVENSPLGLKDPNGLQAQPAKPCCDDKKIKDGLRQLQDALNGAKAAQSAIFQKYKPCLQKLAGDLDVKCGPPLSHHLRGPSPK